MQLALQSWTDSCTVSM